VAGSAGSFRGPASQMNMPPRKLGAHACLLLLLASCYADSDAFARRSAKLSCVNLRECDGAAYDELFDDMRQCRDELENQLQEAIDELPPSCEYQPDEGRDCIHAMYRNRKDCGDDVSDEIAEACERVFECH
jgi:hypothetical protein